MSAAVVVRLCPECKCQEPYHDSEPDPATGWPGCQFNGYEPVTVTIDKPQPPPFANPPKTKAGTPREPDWPPREHIAKRGPFSVRCEDGVFRQTWGR